MRDIKKRGGENYKTFQFYTGVTIFLQNFVALYTEGGVKDVRVGN